MFVILIFLYWLYRLCVSDYVGFRETLRNIWVSYEVAKYLVLKKRAVIFFKAIDQYTVYKLLQHQSSKNIM